MKHLTALFLLFIQLSVIAQLAPFDIWSRADNLQKGFNLSGWLEAGWLGAAYPDVNVYQKSDLAYLKSIGMNTVRLPMLFEWHSDIHPP